MPDATAVITPADDIVATPVVPLVQMPPVVVLVRVAVEPAQADSVPPIAAGKALTVTTALRVQPTVEVNTIVDVPGAVPVTTPALEMGATVGLLLDHVPVEVLVRVDVLPSHTVRDPPIAAGSAFTVKPVTRRHVVGRV